MERKETREIAVGKCKIGGNNPISIQSMTNTNTADVDKTVEQIKRLENAGCEIVRVAVPNKRAADAIEEIKKRINIPLVCDIHFDYRLALLSIQNGADKIRLNPGNIGCVSRVTEVVDAAKKKKIPIRIGVNSGSLEEEIYIKYGGVTAEGLVESALRHAKMLEDENFYDTVISIKSHDVPLTIEAYRLLSQQTDYPLHVGITEAGTLLSGTIKSSVGIGTLLYLGIGDTIRVSLSSDPVEEVLVAKKLLQSLQLRHFGIEFISCPTCGRCNVDLIKIALEVEECCKNICIEEPLKIAIMGCAVNGPGEAKDADLGIAAGDGKGLIFKKGKIIKTVMESEIVNALLEEINTY